MSAPRPDGKCRCSGEQLKTESLCQTFEIFSEDTTRTTPVIKSTCMLTRTSYLLSIGGWNVFLRTAFMLLAAIGFSIFEYFQFGGIYCASATVLLTFVGWMFRNKIMEFGADYRHQSSRILSAYFVCFLIAKYSGLGNELLIVIITVGCMLMFNLNFWSITEAAIVDDQN